jgi:hypothetical protein
MLRYCTYLRSDIQKAAETAHAMDNFQTTVRIKFFELVDILVRLYTGRGKVTYMNYHMYCHVLVTKDGV